MFPSWMVCFHCGSSLGNVGKPEKSRTPISRCPHSCPKTGFQFSGFSAEIVPLHFWGFGLKTVFPWSHHKNRDFSKNCLAILVLFVDPPTWFENGPPVPSTMGPRWCTTSRAHVYPFCGGTSFRQVAATVEHERSQTRGGSGFWSRVVWKSWQQKAHYRTYNRQKYGPKPGPTACIYIYIYINIMHAVELLSRRSLGF